MRMGLRASGARLSRSPTRFRASGGRLSVKKSAFSSHGSFTNLQQGAQRQLCADSRHAFGKKGYGMTTKVAKETAHGSMTGEAKLAPMHSTPHNNLSTIRRLSDVTVQCTVQSATAYQLLQTEHACHGA